MGSILCNLLLTTLWTGIMTRLATDTFHDDEKNVLALTETKNPPVKDFLFFHVLVPSQQRLDIIQAISVTWGKLFREKILFHAIAQDSNDADGEKAFNFPSTKYHLPAKEPVANGALLLIKSIQHACKEDIDSFEWYAFIQSSTYVIAPRLLAFLKYFDSRERHIFCHPLRNTSVDETSLCDLMGFVASSAKMYRVCLRMSFCEKEFHEVSSGGNLTMFSDGEMQLKLMHCLRLTCSTVLSDKLKNFLSHFFYSPLNPYFKYELHLGIFPNPGIVMQSVIMLSGVEKQDNLFNIHYFLTNHTISELKGASSSLEHRIALISKEISKVRIAKSSQPIWLSDQSLPQPTKEQTFSYVSHWFVLKQKGNLSFVESMQCPKRSMRSDEKFVIYRHDFEKIPMEQKANVLYKVDPFRGVDYYFMSTAQDDVFAENHVCREFGLPRVVSLEEVVDRKAKVNFVVSTAPISRQFHQFMMSFESSYLIPRSRESIGLLVVVIKSDQISVDFADGAFVVETIIHLYRKKYPATEIQVVKSEIDPNQYQIARIATELFSPADLIFLGDVHLDLAVDFLKKCRLNTIAGQQVYSPIVFNPYNPSKFHQVRLTLPLVTQFQVTSSSGFWLADSYHTLCIYNDDLKRIVGLVREPSQTRKLSILEEIVREGKLNVFRSVDPGLMHMWQQRCGEIPTTHPDRSKCAQFSEM